MALFKIFKGSNTAKITNSSATGYITPTDGYAYYDTGSKLFYIDAAYSGDTITRQPINADNAVNGVFYGTCTTAQATQAKVATLTNGTGFSLKAGTIVAIKFTYASAASTMTLNVNNTGAKNLYQYGTTLMSSGTTTTGWPAGAVVPFVYDGTYWFRLYWTNTGTVTSVRVQAAAPIVSSSSAAATATLNTTISLAATSANYVIAGPTSGTTTAVPTYRKLVAADIPSLTKSKISDFPTKISAFTNDSGYVTSSGVTSITLKAGTGISLDTDNTAITTSGTRTITNTGVTGIKGNAESTYRTGQVNLTAAQVGAIPADTAGNTQSLSRPSQSNGVNDITLDSKINDLRANRLAFLPPDQIIIEKTTDGGTTWTDAEVSDSVKLSLFSETRPNVYIPLLNDAKNVNCGLRITFTAMKYNVPAGTAETQKYNYWNSNYILSAERYNQLKEMYFWANSNSDTIGVKVERATGANSTNWIKVYDSDENSYGMTGWSGSDYIKFSQGVFGGSITQTNNYWNYRLTFFTRGPGGSKTTLSGTNTSSRQFISEIRGYGDAWWTAGNTYAAKDHLYSFDYLKNATFPAKVTATSFAGNGSALTSLNATNLTSGIVSEDRLPENAKLFKRGTGAYSIASINSSSTTAQPIASGSASVAMGEYTEASGGASTAFGNRGKALGKGSFVCGTVYSGGSESKAVGDGSAVFGASNIVYCSYGASFGAKNIIGDENATANGAYSVACGTNNKIAGGCGFITGGYNEITKGLCGTIFGYSNTVNEGYGTAFGQNNIVNGKYSTVIGKYNEADATVTDSNANGTYSFMIGNGTANDARSNAMEVSWAGDVNAQTSLSVAKAVSMVYNATTDALDFVFA